MTLVLSLRTRAVRVGREGIDERPELVERRGGLVVMEGLARVLSVRARGRGDGEGSRREEVEAVARELEGPGEG